MFKTIHGVLSLDTRASMPRPHHLRHITASPRIKGFKPLGTPMGACEWVTLQLDELEALRLADVEGLYQEGAADLMGVSRVTFGRILQQARTKVATALMEGRGLLFGAGPVLALPGQKDEEAALCPVHGGPRRRGRTCRCLPPDEP